MRRALAALGLALLAGAAPAAERLAVIAVGDQPLGPDGDIAELTHQLRAACRDRVGGVEDVSSMRAHLLGQGAGATESELDRAYGGALAVYQNGEFESALRTLRAIVADLEALPETDESYYQWKRALLRLAQAALGGNDLREAGAAFGKLARTEPSLLPDADQFPPSFRRRFEEVKAKVREAPRRRLAVSAEGRDGLVFLNGRRMGQTPLTLTLPAGHYRIGGAAGPLRVPSVEVDLDAEDRAVVLDFALAASLRVNAGPGLALAPPDRAYGVIRAGAWMGVDKLIVVSRSDEGQAQFLMGSIYDVLRGALLREGSVRMVAGGVPSVNLAALASFLLTGQSSREVKDLSHEVTRRVGPPAVAAAPSGPIQAPAARSAPAPRAAVGAEVPAPAPLAAPPPAALSSTAAAPAAPLPPPAAAQAPPASTRAAGPPAPLAAAPSPPAAPPPSPAAGEAGAPALGAVLPAEPTASRALPSPGVGRPPPQRSGAWRRPVALGAGVLALGLAGFALQQDLAARRSYARADDQLLADGTFKDASAQERWRSLRSEGASERRNVAISAGAAAVLAVTAGVLAWNAWHGTPERGPTLAVEF